MDELVSEKLRKIDHINRVWMKNANDEEGDKHLSQADYAMEATDAVLNGYDSPILRQFMEAKA